MWKRIVCCMLVSFLLMSSALAAQNFSPVDALDARRQALDCLKISAFSAEYRDSTGGRLTRWESSIRLYVGGKPTRADLAELDDFLLELALRVPLLPNITRTNREAEADITIYYVPLSSMGSYAQNYVEGNWGFFTFYHDGAYQRYKGQIVIASDVTNQRQRNHLMKEELVGVLALGNDHELYADSIVYQPWTEVQDLSEVDWLMLNMIYSPYVSCGMTYDQARSALYSAYTR